MKNLMIQKRDADEFILDVNGAERKKESILNKKDIIVTQYDVRKWQRGWGSDDSTSVLFPCDVHFLPRTQQMTLSEAGAISIESGSSFGLS